MGTSTLFMLDSFTPFQRCSVAIIGIDDFMTTGCQSPQYTEFAVPSGDHPIDSTSSAVRDRFAPAIGWSHRGHHIDLLVPLSQPPLQSRYPFPSGDHMGDNIRDALSAVTLPAIGIHNVDVRLLLVPIACECNLQPIRVTSQGELSNAG